jgi:hypothetical protein
MLRLKIVTTRVRTLILLSECFALFMASNLGLRAQEDGPGVHSKALSDSTRRVVFDSSAFVGASAAFPQWDNGYLVSREVENLDAAAINVRLFDKSGSKVSEAGIWFPGSVRVLIYSATATSDGGILVGGKAEDARGADAPFIALVDRTGKMTDVIQTKGFAPANTCQAPDGTVWSFGGTGYDEHSQPKPGDTFRHFDFRKGELSSYLSRSSFPKNLHPGPDVLAYIRCSADEVVAYSASAQEYIEMKYGGNGPHVYVAKVPPGVRLVGFAVTGSKKAYGYFSRGSIGGLYYLIFDQVTETATWAPVKDTVGVYTMPGGISGLWGADGNSLIVSRAEDAAGVTALHWATLVDQ